MYTRVVIIILDGINKKRLVKCIHGFFVECHFLVPHCENHATCVCFASVSVSGVVDRCRSLWMATRLARKGCIGDASSPQSQRSQTPHVFTDINNKNYPEIEVFINKIKLVLYYNDMNGLKYKLSFLK